MLAVKTPMYRPIDVILAGLLISPEIYLWVNLITFGQVWLERLADNKKDGWANQYNAENGKTRSKLGQGILTGIAFIGMIVVLGIYFRDYLTSPSVQQAIYPYLMNGWILLTYLTIYQSLYMFYQIWTLRKHIQA
ncbi:hypothetical protein SFC34_10715 [Priestia aryabhattai]|uniref:hypothetical protein n=1 Tax=Priestia aryabhattai TaxID=412384 RepID=UPI0039828823